MSRRHLNHNGPYLSVRIKRTQKKGSQIPIDINAPVWVQGKYKNRWHRIKLCKNENEAIDLVCLMAESIRPHDPQ